MTYLIIGILIGWMLCPCRERSSGGGVWYGGPNYNPRPPDAVKPPPPPAPPPKRRDS